MTCSIKCLKNADGFQNYFDIRLVFLTFAPLLTHPCDGKNLEAIF